MSTVTLLILFTSVMSQIMQKLHLPPLRWEEMKNIALKLEQLDKFKNP